MNKKHFVSLIFASILLSSCQGASLSYAETMDFLNNIETKIDNNEISYQKFTTTLERKIDGNRVFYQHTIFDSFNNYFHSYTLNLLDEKNNTFSIAEEWNYVKQDSSKVTKIYTVSRKNGESDSKNNPIYTKSLIDYDESVWKDTIDRLNNSMNSVLLFSINEMENLITNDEEEGLNNFNFSSLGESNLSMNGTKNDISYSYSIDNYLLYSYAIKDGSNIESFEANYDRVNIYYPNVD